MVNKTYIVCEIVAVPEQGCEDSLVYVREVSPEDVQPIRKAEREIEEMFLVNRMQTSAKLPPVYSAQDMSDCQLEMERGKFTGFYLVREGDLTFPKEGFTYDKIPEEWKYVADPSKENVGQTNLGELVRTYWNLTK